MQHLRQRTNLKDLNKSRQQVKLQPTSSYPLSAKDIFSTWLKDNDLVASLPHRSTPLESKTPACPSKKSDVSLLDITTNSYDRTHSLISVDKKLATSDLTKIPQSSLDGLYQELILFDEIDFTMAFQLISHGLKPSAPFSVLLIFPGKDNLKSLDVNSWQEFWEEILPPPLHSVVALRDTT
eukprot:CAMPEP_0115021234 /NCGR_PEP_ID=MMETSP0216-20121206/30750_1 /TAXON_ID=223996 /ORGANISM="Protocruzia adherens, Strain Boccale" /LENGTH=180 /DNA_ID=CAMNT_0002393521 /DNA_START=1 /DNA_END=544 /DNA_ORIENTATION=+